MKQGDVNLFVCPVCNGPVRLLDGHPARSNSDEIEKGRLVCEKCAVGYPIANFIPRFVPAENDAASFGHQWNAYARVQTGPDQMPYNIDRFFATTGWPHDLKGQKILEAGCGAGRFTGVALDTGAEVFSFDLSNAVDACFGNVAPPEWRARHHLFQASIYDIPLQKEMFDRIFCLGVLQHCADVKAAFLSLVPFLKPGGELVADCYLSQPSDRYNLKYLLRPFFKWWKPSLLFSFWTAVISITYEMKALLAKIPGIGTKLASWIPIGRLKFEQQPYLTTAEIKEIKTLSVIDMLGPKFDQPQKLSDFEAWTKEAGLELLYLTIGYNGVNIRVRRKVK